MYKLNYQRRIQLSFLMFIFLPIVAVSTVSYVLINDSMVEKVKLSNDNFLNVMTDEINRTIDDISFSSYYVVNDTSFKSLLKKISNTERLSSFEDYETFKQIEDDLTLIASKPLNYNISMYLVNKKNFIITSASDTKTIKWNLEALLEKVNVNKPETMQWLGMFSNPYGSKGEYFIARVIQDPADKQMVSILLISISSAYFEGLVKPIQFGDVALFDADGTRITKNALPNLQNDEPDSSVLRSVIAIQKANWTLVYEASKESLTGPISRTFYTGIAIVFVFFLIFSMSSMYIAKKLYKPIQKLQRVVRQFGMGNLDVRLEVKGKDDIAELGSSLNMMLDQLQQLIYDIEQEQEEKKMMELEALFMQIRPHFLINTLNSIKCSLMLQKDHLHSGVIDSLMSLLRAYLKVNEPVSLREECELLEDYIEIMRIRNEIQISLEVDLESDTEKLMIPKLILQPLIENAIVHGLVDVADARIRVWARKGPSDIQIVIADNGIGAEEEQISTLNHLLKFDDIAQYSSYDRVGLVNVVRRLRLTFGPAANIELSHNMEGGITASIHIPVSKV